MKLLIGRVATSIRYRLNKLFPDYIGESFRCTLCKTDLAYFEPLSAKFLKEFYDNQYIHAIFQLETLNFASYSCPHCGGSDRDRLYALYLTEYFDSNRKPINLVEFAPTPQLRRFITCFSQINYRSADLVSDDVDDKVDLTRMDTYLNEQFDFFISSHMLEHIPDDIAAMSELHRILKPGGRGIVMVPVDLSLNEIYENPQIITEADRWKHFGQFDHVRLYSKAGFVQRLESVGFRVEQLGHSHFGQDKFQNAGIHPRSVLYVVHKDD